MNQKQYQSLLNKTSLVQHRNQLEHTDYTNETTKLQKGIDKQFYKR